MFDKIFKKQDQSRVQSLERRAIASEAFCLWLATRGKGYLGVDPVTQKPTMTGDKDACELFQSAFVKTQDAKTRIDALVKLGWTVRQDGDNYTGAAASAYIIIQALEGYVNLGQVPKMVETFFNNETYADKPAEKPEEDNRVLPDGGDSEVGSASDATPESGDQENGSDVGSEGVADASINEAVKPEDPAEAHEEPA